MLPKIVPLEDKITLIGNTGIQFLDLGFQLDLRREPAGEFVPQSSKLSLARLEYDDARQIYSHPCKPGTAVRSKLSVPMDESAKLLDGVWMPIPLLRVDPPEGYAEGPGTWARARLMTLSLEEQRRSRQTHRVTLAIDTTVMQTALVAKYVAPTTHDVQSGAVFRLAGRADHIGWFPELPWVSEWLSEVFSERAETALRLAPDETESQRGQLLHHAHYLNLLALIRGRARVPEIKLVDHQRQAAPAPVPVDLILDIGNSRTCGILIEEHQHEQDALTWSYQLGLRDLSEPHRVYTDPFESRLEFSEASFGKSHIAHKSGRADAFRWPTIARVGPEAARLAACRRGTEGATGLSSPKRYLWDQDRFVAGWRFNKAFVRSDIEPHATAEPLCNLINELGEPLYELEPAERIPVLRPNYARSATMMLMLSEIIAQALCQMNSAAQRLRMPNCDIPRTLRSVILTIPPSMPKPERDLLTRRAHQAVALVWQAYEWHPPLEAIDGDGAELAWPPLPRVETRWDEATCAQAVYLYTEIQNSFAGHPEELFATLRRTHSPPGCDQLTIATIDIGGGTTDLVINDYVLRGKGANVNIVPVQRFRDGFKIAGDDVLLDCIQAVIIPALQESLREAGIQDPQSLRSLLAELLGTSQLDVQESVLRQQLTLQVWYPAGLAILKRYEDFDPLVGAERETQRVGELIAAVGAEPPTEAILRHFEDKVRTGLPDGSEPPRLLDIKVPLDLGWLHAMFTRPDGLEITRPLDSLCEIVHRYECDVLLLTGRPSRLPGIRDRIASLLPLPPDRILGMNDFRTGAWYPFHHQGRIRDPKTTAVVGAMLCMLGQGRLHNFFFRANEFMPYSTVRYLGLMDLMMSLKDNDVFYSNVNLDDEDYQLPDAPFPFRGKMRLGYRQLDVERWTASPLYVLDFASEEARAIMFPKDDRRARATSIDQFMIRLERVRRGGAELLRIADIQTAEGAHVARDAVQIKLNTLVSFGTEFATQYWLDSGIVYRGP